MSVEMLSLTVSGASYAYPSYVTVDEATEYLAADPELGAGWLALSPDDMVRRLVAATRRLDRLPWSGERAGGRAQATAWPREGLEYPDGEAIATTDIPAAVDEAAILLAGDVLVDLSASAGGQAEQVRSMTAGRIMESFFYREISELETLLPGATLSLIKYWLKRRNRRRPTVTGRDSNQPSEFSERYEREIRTGDISDSYGSRRRS